jgi:hypothetical protein
MCYIYILYYIYIKFLLWDVQGSYMSKDKTILYFLLISLKIFSQFFWYKIGYNFHFTFCNIKNHVPHHSSTWLLPWWSWTFNGGNYVAGNKTGFFFPLQILCIFPPFAYFIQLSVTLILVSLTAARVDIFLSLLTLVVGFLKFYCYML